jgi:hypothetical protein
MSAEDYARAAALVERLEDEQAGVTDVNIQKVLRSLLRAATNWCEEHPDESLSEFLFRIHLG